MSKKVLSPRTKKAQEYINAYYRSDIRGICSAYQHPSDAKIDAYQNCLRIMREYDGVDLRIISYNKCFFTAMFRTRCSFFVITYCNIYEIYTARGISEIDTAMDF